MDKGKIQFKSSIPCSCLKHWTEMQMTVQNLMRPFRSLSANCNENFLLASEALDRDAEDGTKSDEAFQEFVSKLQRAFPVRF